MEHLRLGVEKSPYTLVERSILPVIVTSLGSTRGASTGANKRVSLVEQKRYRTKTTEEKDIYNVRKKAQDPN